MKKCLIVDDEPVSGEMLSVLLSNHFGCRTVTSGMEAWEIIESSWHNGDPFDLICCDLCLPQLSGHALIRKIRSLEKTAPSCDVSPTKVFVVTAGLPPWDMGESLFDDVADGYITKPCQPKELFELLFQNGLVESIQL